MICCWSQLSFASCLSPIHETFSQIVHILQYYFKQTINFLKRTLAFWFHFTHKNEWLPFDWVVSPCMYSGIYTQIVECYIGIYLFIVTNDFYELPFLKEINNGQNPVHSVSQVIIFSTFLPGKQYVPTMMLRGAHECTKPVCMCARRNCGTDGLLIREEQTKNYNLACTMNTGFWPM